VRIVVNQEDRFTCPYCGEGYEIEPYEGDVAVVYAREGRYCSHLDPEILPTQGGWEVYFSA